MAIPLSPEEEARIAAYYGGQPGVNMSSATVPAPPPPDPAQYFGPPVAPPSGAAPPMADPFGAGAAKMGIAPPPPERAYGLDVDPTQVRGAALAEPPRGAPGFGAPPKAAPPVAPGPSARDNAEFEAFKAQQGAATPKPRPSGGGGGAKPNPDPYGIQAAGTKAVGSFDTQMAAQQHIAEAEAEKSRQIGIHAAELAQRRQEDLNYDVAHAEETDKRLDASIAETQRQIDDVRSKKVNPLGFMGEDERAGIIAVVGGVFGGLAQWGMGLKSNPFLDSLDRMIDRQVSVDERNLDRQQTGLNQKMNLLQQQRALYGDDRTSRLQYKNLMYEAVKDQLAAEAQQYDSPLYTARAENAIGELERGQAMLQKQLGEQLRSQAMAGASQALARQREVIGVYRDVYDKALAAGLAPSQAEFEAKRQVGILYAPGSQGDRPPEAANDFGMGKSGREKIAAERYEAQQTSDEFNSQVDAMKKHPALEDLGVTTGPLSHLGPRVAPGSSKTVQDLQQLNTQIINAIGKVARDAEGKPNVAMMERYEKRFTIEPGDTKEIALQKIEGARSVVNSLARQHGATGAPKPSARQDADEALGARTLR